MQLIGPARLFGGPSGATGEAAQLFLDASAVEVDTPGGRERVPLAELRVREVGGGPIGLELAWDAPEGARAVHVFDGGALRTLQAQPAIAALPSFRATRAGRRRRSLARTVAWTLLALVLLAPVLLLAGFLLHSDRIAAAVADNISIADEMTLGRKAFESMRPDLTLTTEGAGYSAVQTLGAKLTRDSPYRYEFHVARDDAVNAFALPGGVIVVNTGLIAATRRPEELAGVLAHEVQHVELRHSLQGLIKQLGLRALWLLATGDVGQGALGQTALQLTSLTFSRDAERAADAHGFDALVNAGIDPRGMAEFFATLAKQEQGAPPEFLSTHPASQERERALREREAKIAERTFPPLDFGAWPPS